MLNLSPRELIIATVKHGQPPLMVFGDAETLNVVSLQADRETIAEHYANGLRYCGLLGWSDGPKIALREDAGSIEIEVMRRAGVAFAQQHLGDAGDDIETVGDAVEWIERLWALSDTRTEEL
jgi:hypothetical protein